MAKEYRLYIPESEFDNIKSLLANIENIQKSIDSVKQCEYLTIDFLKNTISSSIENKENEAKNITDVLLNLSYAQESLQLDEDMLIDELIEFCKRYKDKLGDQIKIIKDKTSILRTLFNVNSPVNIMRKSLNLAISEKKIYRSSKIITDIRPIYNNDGTEIQRLLIINKLQIKYNENNKFIEDYFEIDLDDITEIAKNCERVLQKVNVIKETMSKTDIPICLVGGNDE